MKEKKPSTNIPVIFQNLKEYEHEDDRFLKVKIWLMHTEKNLNGSSFSKEVVNKAIPTLANTPLLAFIEENSVGEQDFSDHRIVLHRTEDGELNLKYAGEYVGLIPETNNAKWEFRVTDSGEMREYLTVEALMWTKRNEPIDIMKRKGFTSQSMELSNDYTGYYDESGTFHFESFKFFGACLLGNDVLPAMENSTAEIQYATNTKIQENIEKKLQEFYALFSQDEPKGGNEMAEKVEKDYEKTEVEFEQVEETEAAETDQAEVEIVEEVETETTEVADSPSDNPDNSTDAPETDEDEQSTEDTEEVTELDEEAETDADETVEEGEPKVDYEAKFNEVNTELETLKTDYTSLQSQLAELQTYKRQREEADLKAKFEGKLSDEEFTQVFTDMKDSELDKVEEKLFALIGKKNFSIQTKTKTDVNKVTIVSPKEKEFNPYGDIFDEE